MKVLLSFIALCLIGCNVAAMEEKVINNALISQEQNKIAECPICCEDIYASNTSEEKKALSVVCCNNFFHAECLGKWDAQKKVCTCPLCRSGDKPLVIKEKVKCGICLKQCTNEDSVIPLECEVRVRVAEKMSNLYQNQGAFWSFVSLPAVIVQAAAFQTEHITDFFHEECLRNYYSTEKAAHDNNFGEIVYYCPIHKDSPVKFSNPKFAKTLQLPDKTIMTDEEVIALVEKIEQKEQFERRLRNF